MARKYGKNETTLSNVLKLVKALLALADEEIAVPGDKLKATFKVEWVKEDELLVSGKVQQKHNNRTQTVEKGITKEDLWTLVECLGEALELSQPKDEKKKPTEAERKANAVQDVLDCLKDLELFDDKRSATNSPYWKFSLKLNHQTKTKEENLKVIKEQWKIKIGTVTVETTCETTFISKDQPLNWQEICRQNLAQQKQLTTNPFTNAYGVTPQLDDIYVPLAIVERKPPKPPSRNQQNEKEKEKLIPITEESFFEDVLRQGKSDISQGRKIAIIGEPGSGKTTRLQKIADWILEQDLGLPIWISLADLTQPTITQYIEEIWLKPTGKNLTIDEITQQKERIWLLLDGLDEMTSRVETRHVSALLGGWVQAARVVVTCRVNVWEADKNAFSGFDVFRNLEYNPEQVTEYIRNWFAKIGDAATGESLEAALAQSENSRLKELIQNPLRLWMLCQIWQLRAGVLPDTKAKLYEQFVKYFYRWNKHEKTIKEYVKLCGMNQRECKENLHKALGDLAKAALTQKYSFFRLSYGLVDEYLGDENEETSLLSLALSLAWLNRSGLDVDEPEKSAYAFYHTTFQEYFAALAVDDWDYFLPRNHVNFPVAGKEYRIFEPQWKQVILLWLGRKDVKDEEKDGFIEKLVNFDDGCGDFYGQQAYLLAEAGNTEFVKFDIDKLIPIDKLSSISTNDIDIMYRWAMQKNNRWIELSDWLYHINNSLSILSENMKNLKNINVFVNLFTTTYCRQLAIEELKGIITTCNPKFFEYLTEKNYSQSDKDMHCLIAWFSGEIDNPKLELIKYLSYLLKNSKDILTHTAVFETLYIIIKKQIFCEIIPIFKEYIKPDSGYSYNSYFYRYSYGITRYIASSINYLEFYNAWYS